VGAFFEKFTSTRLVTHLLQFFKWIPLSREPVKGKGAWMEKLTQQNIQEAFLNNARKDKTFLTIYLMSGVKLSGRIKSFDKYSVILEASNQEQLIFKHAISTVVVSKTSHFPAAGHVAPGPPGPAQGPPAPAQPEPGQHS
jgi:host factor-I protein